MSLVAVARKGLFAPFSHRFFSSATQIPDPKSSSPFIVKDYLVSTFGITPAKVATISKPIARLKSPLNPDAVHSFLQRQGFGDAEIKTIITKQPSILCSSPQNTLTPNLRALRDIGLSTSALTQIILSGPQALQVSSAASRIKFWNDFVGGEEAALVKLCKRNRGLLNLDINGGIATKISLLRSYGIATHHIQRIICTLPSFINRSVSKIEDLLKRAKELGFQPESGMFVQGLVAMGSANKEALQKKLELLKSFGWSEEEFLSAVRKIPTMLCLSEENLRAKMNFLLEEARLENSYISFHPGLLTCCLEQRLKPRQRVLHLLQSKDSSGKKINFYNAIRMSNNDFVVKYINPHMEEIPELLDVYLVGSASGTI